MPADRLLGTLLRSLQTYTKHQDTPRILGTAVSLFTTLNNPLNLTLLTTQLLCAPALWTRPDGLRACLSFMGVFHSAAIRIKQRESERAEKSGQFSSNEPQFEAVISSDEWVRSVVKGADERSMRAYHLLIFGGLLIGFENGEDDFLPYSLKATLQDAFVTATNLVLEDPTVDELSHLCTSLALNHTFPHLSDFHRSRLDYDRLLPVLMHAMLHSAGGLGSGYFISAIDPDVQQVSARQFNWAASSSSFLQIQRIATSPLISSLGPLSRLVSHTIEQLRESWLVDSLVDDVAEFSARLCSQWRRNKLSEIDPAEEEEFLAQEARSTTIPVLWKLMRTTLYSVVFILQSAAGRILSDGSLARDRDAPRLAQQSLRILCDLNFVFSRLGSTAFSQYTFTYFASIDILANYPTAAENFLQSIAPKTVGQIPMHPLDRVQDLFFLNAAEHFTAVLTPRTNEELLIATASPYLVAGGNPHLLPIFEAAHSIMLAVFAGIQGVDLTTKHLPFYVDALFKVFPQNLSSRQFRFAFKNLVKIASPPSRIAQAQPLLAATLLELVHERATHAPITSLPVVAPKNVSGDTQPAPSFSPPLSEQAVLVLTLIDSLPALSVDLLEEWLPLTAALVNRIQDRDMREHCREHMWDTMVRGEMDADRSQVCVAWWTTLGGREALLMDRGNHSRAEFTMSGALPDEMAKL